MDRIDDLEEGELYRTPHPVYMPGSCVFLPLPVIYRLSRTMISGRAITTVYQYSHTLCHGSYRMETTKVFTEVTEAIQTAPSHGTYRTFRCRSDAREVSSAPLSQTVPGLRTE